MTGSDTRNPEKGRALWPSLFISCALLPAIAASLLNAALYWWIAIVLLYLGGLKGTEGRLPANALAAAVLLTCAWLLADAVLLTPHYAHPGIYRPAMLLVACWAASRLSTRDSLRLFRVGVAVVALLVLIGMLQSWAGFYHVAEHGDRASALFGTPNTFATVINLALLPLVALSLAGRGGISVYVLSLFFFEGLLSTGSRGGWLAFVVAVAFVAAYRGVPRGKAEWGAWSRIAIGLFCVGLLHVVARSFLSGSGLVETIVTNALGRGGSYRADLASVTLARIAEHPLIGHGANMFSPLWEMTKPASLDMEMSFPYAHNDYLQLWLEYGAPGILGFLCIAGTALAIAFKARRDKSVDPLPLACASAVAVFYAHALVDFPTYIAFPELQLGLCLGILARYRGDQSVVARLLASVRGLSRSVFLGRVLALAAFAWLAQPAVAEMAADKAVARLLEGKPQEALYWQVVARRFEPRSGHRYWEEGVIWRDQAVETRNPALAAKADETFAAGMQVDPYDPANVFERVRLYRRYPELMGPAVSREQVVAWASEGLKLRPLSVNTRAEYARALAFAGRFDEARKLSRDLLRKRPDSENARILVKELAP